MPVNVHEAQPKSHQKAFGMRKGTQLERDLGKEKVGIFSPTVEGPQPKHPLCQLSVSLKYMLPALVLLTRSAY